MQRWAERPDGSNWGDYESDVVDQSPVVESANSNKIQRSKLQDMARIALAADAARHSSTR